MPLSNATLAEQCRDLAKELRAAASAANASPERRAKLLHMAENMEQLAKQFDVRKPGHI